MSVSVEVPVAWGGPRGASGEGEAEALADGMRHGIALAMGVFGLADPLVMTATASHAAEGLRFMLRIDGRDEVPVAKALVAMQAYMGPVLQFGDPRNPAEVPPVGEFERWLRPLRAGVPDRRPAALGAWPVRGLSWSAIHATVSVSTNPITISTLLAPASLSGEVLTLAMRRAVGLANDYHWDPSAVLEPLLELTRAPIAVRCELYVRAGDQAGVELVRSAVESAGQVGLRCIADPLPRGASGASEEEELTQLVLSGRITVPQRAAGLFPFMPPMRDPSAPPPVSPVNIDNRGTEAASAEEVLLGRTAAGTSFGLRVKELSHHLLVAGAHGFGKSTTVKSLLARLWTRHHVPFLVIDAGGRDYVDFAAALGEGGEAVAVLQLGADATSLNPLSVPAGVDPSVFAAIVCQCLESALPGVGSGSVVSSVVRNTITELFDGWVVEQGLEAGWPTIAELYRAALEHIARAGEALEIAGDLHFLLGERIAGMVTGLNGEALSGGPRAGLDWARLLSRPAVLTLVDYGDHVSRVLALRLLLAGLIAFRDAHPLTDGVHMSVLEGAATLLWGGDPDLPNAQKMANLLTTQTQRGQGYVVVAQTPGLLPQAILDVLQTRILHRLTGHADSQFAGGDNSVAALAALGRGEVLLTDPNRAMSAARIRVDAPPSALAVRDLSGMPAAGSDLVGAGLPDRIWCTQCPAPCRGRRWLEVVPDVAEALLTQGALTEDLQDQARMAAVLAGRYARQRGLPLSIRDVGPSVYCATARTLTLLHAADRGKAAAALAQARNVAEDAVETVWSRRAEGSEGPE
jgi:hypothetical protein